MIPFCMEDGAELALADVALWATTQLLNLRQAQRRACRP